MIIFPMSKGNACVKEHSTAYSYIDNSGKINVKAVRSNYNFENVKLPFFRGVSYFLFGIYLFFKNIISSYNFSFEEKNAKNKNSFFFLFISIIVGFAVGFIGFVLMPYLIFNSLGKTLNYGLLCLISSAVRVVSFAIILLIFKLIPSVNQFYKHNAAGNLAIKENSGKNTGNYHLSTNFLSYSITCFFILVFVLSFTAFDVNYIWKLLINISISLFTFGFVYEIMLLAEKNKVLNSILVKPFSFLVTSKPSITEKNIASSAICEAQLMEENNERLIEELSGKDVPMSVVFSEVKQKLKNAGIEAASEAEWLIAECLNKNRNEIRLQSTVTKEEYKKIAQATAKREKHMPLTKIFNRACFYGLDFYVDKNVLSPRPETELLVEEVIKTVNSSELKKVNILDLCTGSGAIAVVLAKKTNAKITASDVSESALDVAKKNAAAHDANVKFVSSDLFKNIKGKFDYIVSNPPYIKTQDILALEDEVKKNDPYIALDGGEDGLYFYREIARLAPEFLNKNGKLFLEIGIGEAKSVKKLLQKNFENIKIKKDYSAIERIIVADLKGK